MLPEALRPKLFTGSVNGPQGMDKAVPRGLSAQSMQSVLRRAQMSPPGAVPVQNFLGVEDLNMNESPGSYPKSRL